MKPGSWSVASGSLASPEPGVVTDLYSDGTSFTEALGPHEVSLVVGGAAVSSAGGWLVWRRTVITVPRRDRRGNDAAQLRAITRAAGRNATYAELLSAVNALHLCADARVRVTMDSTSAFDVLTPFLAGQRPEQVPSWVILPKLRHREAVLEVRRVNRDHPGIGLADRLGRDYTRQFARPSAGVIQRRMDYWAEMKELSL